MKAEIIPKRILEMAEEMRKSKESGFRTVFMPSRRHGITLAQNLAFNTEDTHAEEQKNLPAASGRDTGKEVAT